jgi:type I restriction enzyme, R subunit
MGRGTSEDDQGRVRMHAVSKRMLSESDICDQYITPANVAAGWDMTTQIRREFGFTAGRIIVRGQLKRVDYLLFYQPNPPIAVVEAKDNNYPIGGGMQQGLAYAKALDVPFVFSSNGDAFVFQDRTGLSHPVERTLSLHEFPPPGQVWSRY